MYSCKQIRYQTMLSDIAYLMQYNSLYLPSECQNCSLFSECSVFVPHSELFLCISEDEMLHRDLSCSKDKVA